MTQQNPLTWCKTKTISGIWLAAIWKVSFKWPPRISAETRSMPTDGVTFSSEAPWHIWITLKGSNTFYNMEWGSLRSCCWKVGAGAPWISKQLRSYFSVFVLVSCRNDCHCKKMSSTVQQKIFSTAGKKIFSTAGKKILSTAVFFRRWTGSEVFSSC